MNRLFPSTHGPGLLKCRPFAMRISLQLHLFVFLGAFLLFTMEPLVARMVLPVHGGSFHVWTTTLTFFQGALFLGYVYCHLLARRLGGWHLLLVAAPLIWLPVANGIGLSATEDELYVAETVPGRLWAFKLEGPGSLAGHKGERRLLLDRPGFHMFDSLAVDADGGVCVATIIDGGITTLYPNGASPKFMSMPDTVTTNICFGGEDLRTAYITLSSTGQLVSLDWHTAGLPLNYLNC